MHHANPSWHVTHACLFVHCCDRARRARPSHKLSKQRALVAPPQGSHDVRARSPTPMRNATSLSPQDQARARPGLPLRAVNGGSPGCTGENMVGPAARTLLRASCRARRELGKPALQTIPEALARIQSRCSRRWRDEETPSQPLPRDAGSAGRDPMRPRLEVYYGSTWRMDRRGQRRRPGAQGTAVVLDARYRRVRNTELCKSSVHGPA